MILRHLKYRLAAKILLRQINKIKNSVQDKRWEYLKTY